MKKLSRKAVKGLERTRRWLGTTWSYALPVSDKPIAGLRYFCQNAGSCGSSYIVELMKANGHGACYHELPPALDALGIKHFEGKVGTHRLRSLLSVSRRHVFFEANNRLFAMTRELQTVFPDSKFIHLHRDARDLIPSSLSKPPQMTWNSGRLRYRSEMLCGHPQMPVLERACHYWANYNERILRDMEGIDGLSLKFEDLINGRLEDLESFMGRSFDVPKLSPVNADKPVRSRGRYPDFADWPKSDRQTLLRICGATLQKLGYSLADE